MSDKTKVKIEVDLTELLISSIQARRPLWCHYNQRIPGILKHKQKLWAEVAKLLKYSVDDTKNIWKSLRKGFDRQLKKIPKTEDNKFLIHPQLHVCTWRYYNSMQFLVDPKDVHQSVGTGSKKRKLPSETDVDNKIRRIQGNLELKKEPVTNSPVEIISTEVIDDGENTPVEKQLVDLSTSDVSTSNSNTISNDLSNGGHQYEVVVDLLQSGTSAREGIEGNDETEENNDQADIVEEVAPCGNFSQFDSDFYFLMSLHEMLKPLPPHQKMTMRTVICGYVTEQIANSNI